MEKNKAEWGGESVCVYVCAGVGGLLRSHLKKTWKRWESSVGRRRVSRQRPWGEEGQSVESLVECYCKDFGFNWKGAFFLVKPESESRVLVRWSQWPNTPSLKLTDIPPSHRSSEHPWTSPTGLAFLSFWEQVDANPEHSACLVGSMYSTSAC